MLVTRKSVAQDRNKVSRQPAQKTAHQSHKVNPFGPLQHADDEGGESLLPTSGRTTVEQTRRNKGKDAAPNGPPKRTASRVSAQGTRTDRQQTKGKAKNSNHLNTAATSVPTTSQQPPSIPNNSNTVATHERSVPTSTTSPSPRPSQQVRRRVVQPSCGRGASRGKYAIAGINKDGRWIVLRDEKNNNDVFLSNVYSLDTMQLPKLELVTHYAYLSSTPDDSDCYIVMVNIGIESGSISVCKMGDNKFVMQQLDWQTAIVSLISFGGNMYALRLMTLDLLHKLLAKLIHRLGLGLGLAGRRVNCGQRMAGMEDDIKIQSP
nr:uncharacterized protein LOC109181746 [Ipomoea trifida]